MSNYLILDIETEPLPEAELRPFLPKIEPPSNYKDAAKIEAYIAEKQAEAIERAALSVLTGRVLAVGLKDGPYDIKTWEGSESGAIGTFWDYWRGCCDRIIGHNIKGFDLPFLIRRSYALGISVPSDVMEGRHFNRRVVDTMELWDLGTRERISLDNFARFLGVGSKPDGVSGKDFARLYHDPATRDKALEYLRNDLVLTEAVAKRMGII